MNSMSMYRSIKEKVVKNIATSISSRLVLNEQKVSLSSIKALVRKELLKVLPISYLNTKLDLYFAGHISSVSFLVPLVLHDVPSSNCSWISRKRCLKLCNFSTKKEKRQKGLSLTRISNHCYSFSFRLGVEFPVV